MIRQGFQDRLGEKASLEEVTLFAVCQKSSRQVRELSVGNVAGNHSEEIVMVDMGS